MKRLKRMTALAAALVATAAVARAEDGDAAAGHAFARNACQPCHAVEAEQRKPRRIAGQLGDDDDVIAFANVNILGLASERALI